MSDGTADGVHFVKCLGKKGDPAGAIGHYLQSAPGAFGMLFISQNRDRVHRRSVVSLQTTNACSSDWVLAVSSPSVTTKMTFFSSLPRFSQSAEATTAS